MIGKIGAGKYRKRKVIFGDRLLEIYLTRLANADLVQGSADANVTLAKVFASAGAREFFCRVLEHCECGIFLLQAGKNFPKVHSTIAEPSGFCRHSFSDHR